MREEKRTFSHLFFGDAMGGPSVFAYLMWLSQTENMKKKKKKKKK